MRIVVGAAAAEVDHRHAALRQATQQFDRFGQIILQRIIRAGTKAKLVGQQLVKSHRLARLAASAIRHDVEHTEPHADNQLRNLFAHSSDDFQQWSAASLEIAAELSWPLASAQEFVQQVSMARLHIDELKTNFAG